MKKIFLLILSFFIFSPLIADIKINLDEFSGGTFDFNMKIYTDSLYGARGDGMRLGGTVSTLDFHPSFTSYNPACLAFLKGPVASMSGIPFEAVSSKLVEFFLGQNFSDNIKDQVDKQLDKSIRDSNGLTVAPGVTIGTQGVTAYMAQGNAIMGLEGMLPFAQNNAAVGVAREEKFTLEMNMLLSGLEALVNMTDPSDPSFAMSMRAKVDAAAALKMQTIVTSIGLGRKLTQQWGVGVVLERIETNVTLNGNASADATGTLLGNTLQYNTGDSNSLEQTAQGDLSAAAWGLRVGTSVRAPGDIAEIALDFSIQPNMQFSGTGDLMTHMPPKDSGQLINDFLSGSTETEEKHQGISGTTIYMKLPSFMRVGIAWKPGPVLAFNYTRYFDDFSISMDNKDSSGRVFLAMRDAFRIGFNFEYFQMGGGIILASEGVRQEDKNAGTGSMTTVESPIPVFSMGWIIPMGQYVITEWELLAVPMPVLKAAITYMF
jgi:hypothetical protein